MNTSDIELNPTARALLQEAAEWRLIGLLFECPGPHWQEQVASLASELTDTDLKAASAAIGAEASAGFYHTIFGPGGPAATREVSYHEDLLPGAMLSELRGIYDAFAYQPAITEPPDHVAVEAGFVAYVRMKEAYAQLRGDAQQQEICTEASRSFIDHHLRVMAHPLAKSLSVSGVEYLTLTANALRSHVGDPLSANIPLVVVSQDDDEDEMACAH